MAKEFHAAIANWAMTTGAIDICFSNSLRHALIDVGY
jgi:hypothetical protein